MIYQKQQSNRQADFLVSQVAGTKTLPLVPQPSPQQANPVGAAAAVAAAARSFLLMLHYLGPSDEDRLSHTSLAARNYC